MRTAKVFVCNEEAGILSEVIFREEYRFEYKEGYNGFPVSLTMPLDHKSFIFKGFPPFFDGLLPEGYQLEGLLTQGKVDGNDYFSQLLLVGNELVGAVTVKESEP